MTAPPVPSTLCTAALSVAHQVADLLGDAEHVAGISREAKDALPSELFLPAWQPASLLLGHPGIALLHIRCAQDDAARKVVAHAHLSAAVASSAAAGPGAAGSLLLPAHLHARAYGGYTRLLARCGEVHAAYVRARLAGLVAHRQEYGPGMAYGDYDTITGLAGEGRSLLLAADHGDEKCARVLPDVLSFLVEMTRPVGLGQGKEHQVPGWWCSPDRYLIPRDRQEFPRGDFNVGVAHGICGPLALLSLAQLSGHRVPGQLEAIRSMADWVLSVRRTDQRGTRWPGRIGYEEIVGDPCEMPRQATGARSRAGWCYGISGISWTLYLAGQALCDSRMTDVAAAAVSALLCRPLEGVTPGDPGFCHGRAGILHTAVRLAAAGHTELWESADRIAQELVGEFDAHAPFGYPQVLSPPSPQAMPYRTHDPGVLDGAAGIALALAGYADARGKGVISERNGWDAMFLMS
ncbi:lanthionine synthetase LanC family protein [Streptomyces sp. NPDC039022]|uniref:lanthionine synthetase LanC family protein n=1 Tax=unclassified Streptomyces TaxID=2593676 RepID=UPI0033E84CBB